MKMTVMRICCSGRVSAVGPTCMRRSSAAGLVRIRYTVGIQVDNANTARNAQPCQ
jgi:hypothetical protein